MCETMTNHINYIEKDNFKTIVGELIRKIRIEELHITQEQLAERVGCERAYISAIECGYKNVSFYTMYKIILALDIEPNKLFNQI